MREKITDDRRIKIIQIIILIMGLFLITATILIYIRLYYPKYRLTNTLNFSKDGVLLLVSMQSKIQLWETNTGEIVKSYNSNLAGDIHTGSSLSPDKKYIANHFYDYSEIVDLNKEKRIYTFQAGEVGEFSPDSKCYIWKKSRFEKPIIIFDIEKKETRRIAFDIIENVDESCVCLLKNKIDGKFLVFIDLSDINKQNKIIKTLKIHLFCIEKERISKSLTVYLNKDLHMQNILTGGNKIFLFFDGEAIIADMETLKTKNYKLLQNHKSSFIPFPCVAYDGKLFAVIDYISKLDRLKPILNVYESETGKIVNQVELYNLQIIENVAISNKTSAVGFQKAIGRGLNGTVILYDIESNKEIKKMKME